MKAYKAFDDNLQCRGFQFEVGETYTLPGDSAPELCARGFHACEKLQDCYGYYPDGSRICEVEMLGTIVGEGGDKIAASSIRIVRELGHMEILSIRNSGRNCTGRANSGNHNSGDYNSGHYNSGDRNSGCYNSGDYNSGNHNSGHYNTDEPTIRMFNEDTGYNNEDLCIPYMYLPLTWWESTDTLSAEERKKYPEGVLRTRTYKEAWAIAWEAMDEETRQQFRDLPNFCPKIFEEITGIPANSHPKKRKGKKK